MSDNTISNNVYGILAGPLLCAYNNIQNNAYYGFVLDSSNFVQQASLPASIRVTYEVNATNNWWGTTDASAVNQTIYDFKNDAILGEVFFMPFLTAPNSAAPARGYTPTAGATVSAATLATPNVASPAPTRAVPEIQTWIILPLFAAISVLLLFFRHKLKWKSRIAIYPHIRCLHEIFRAICQQVTQRCQSDLEG
jgi:hypothetical protein